MYTINYPTKKDLIKLKIGDAVTINDWDSKLYVFGQSENYVLLAEATGERREYTVISKQPADFGCNNITHGKTYCGPDWWSFGYISAARSDGKQYDFDNPSWVKEYLESFENGYSEISQRHGCTIKTMAVEPK